VGGHFGFAIRIFANQCARRFARGAIRDPRGLISQALRVGRESDELHRGVFVRCAFGHNKQVKV
jgi:hypothetical protein